MLETGIQVSLGGKKHDVLEVSMVDVGVHSEEALEYNLYDVDEVLWERHTKLTGENLFIVKLVLDPSHEEINVF